MKKTFRSGFYAFVCLSLFTSSIYAASVAPITAPIFIQPVAAPAVVIPFAPVAPVATENAIKEFKSLSKAERKERVKEAKSAIKEFKKQKKAGSEPSTNQLLLVILAILLPPLAVYLHEGKINSKFWLDLILTLLFFLPGVIYALIVVLGKD